MYLTTLLTLIPLSSAVSIFSRSDLTPRSSLQVIPPYPLPTDCVPLSCHNNSTVICSNTTNTQTCQDGNLSLTDLGRSCSNETYAPTYPLTNYCVDILAPYDAAQVPGDCSLTMCADWDGEPKALWCLYFQTNGMVWRRLQMECAPTA
jgi:hypothetical protein